MIRDAIVDAVVHAPDLIRQVAIRLISSIKKVVYNNYHSVSVLYI